MDLEFTLNGKYIVMPDIDDDMLLVDLIRNVLHLTGTKRGCETGVCGACSVLLDDKLVKSCRIPVKKAHGHAITTIEGLRKSDGGLSDIQQAFLSTGAVQCGFCTPGMVLAADALLRANPNPDRHQIRRGINANLCRCTGYQQIIDAVEMVVHSRKGEVEVQRSHKASKSKHQFVGNPEVINVDGPEKVTGFAKYVGDMEIPGMLYAKVLRSPVPHARITRLDVTPALQIPGVCTAITCQDFVDNGNFGCPVQDQYILAYGKVRYVGDAIAAVAAETELAAQLGIEAIFLQLKELPVVSDMHQALHDDAQIIPDKPVNLTAGGYGKGNLCDHHILRNGQPEPTLSTCPTILDETYVFPHQEHAYIETEAVLAIPESDGSVTLYANNQSPFINRDYVASVMGIVPRLVRVIQPPVGGAFGGKDDILYQTSAQAAKLALISNRPVRLALSRSESMAASYKRPAMQSHLSIGVNKTGHLQAAKVDILTDSGAYASMTPMSSWRATMHAAGAYRYNAVHVDSTAVYTNNGYAGAFRGFGNVQASAAVEMAIDELAYKMRMDPLEFRLVNCLRQGDRTMTGDVIDHETGLEACLNWVRDASEWGKKRAANTVNHTDRTTRKGIGAACYFHGSGLGGEGEDFAVSTMKIEADYNITLTSGLTDYGQGSRTVFSLLAAEVLGVQMNRVRMLRPDTLTAVDSGPTVASRASIVGGNAVRVTAEKLLHQLHLSAANAAKCTPDQLVREGENFIGPDEVPMCFEMVVDHAREMGFQLSVEGRWQIEPIIWDFKNGTGKPYFAYVFGALAAEVEVNTKTGRTRVTGIWAAHDAGQILYPLGAMGQLYGGIIQGLGYALMEDFRYVDAIPQSLGLNTYSIPRANDVPEIVATYIQTSHHTGPFGAKNLAEPVMIGVAPAIANAVFHATGKRIRSLPISPDKVKS
jgi:CO/xanthine dehydrogenase Mo-binding subunit/aerobic-type carbon monoxide dehydrogenase small subunit (CoxS/CutS family)